MGAKKDAGSIFDVEYLEHGVLHTHMPEIHSSDQGVQYAAHTYVDRLKEYQVQISMAVMGKAGENCYAERLMETIKEGEDDLSEYEGFVDAHGQISRFT